MKNLFGIMQGRLLPKYLGRFQAHPVGYWQKEFKMSSELGFDCIEFIFDYHLFDMNPLFSDEGLDLILFETKNNNVLVKSICADYFMNSPIFSDEFDKNIEVLSTLYLNAKKIGVKDIIIPCVDNSSLLHDNERLKSTIKFFESFFKINNVEKVNICLESDLPPEKFIELINAIDHPQIKINYDTGNSASLGYNFKEEFELYGHLITNIHIKDRKFNGGSVELGLGDCDFKKIFKHLARMEYKGLFILQAFRNEDGLSSVIPQYNYIKKCFNKYFDN